MREKIVTGLWLLTMLFLIPQGLNAQLFEVDASQIQTSDEKKYMEEHIDEDDFFNDPRNVEYFLQQLQRGEGRIVGGEDVLIRDYPWQVSLQLTPQFGGAHMCGGTIVDEEWILTAAHCLVVEQNGEDFYLTPAHVRIRAGFTSMSDPSQGSYYNVSELHLHPDYSTSAYPNDIALIRLSSEIDLADINKAKVGLVSQLDADNGMTDIGEMVKVSGWGALSFGGPGPDILQAIEVPIVHVSQTSYSPHQITTDMIIAGAPGQDSCQGDSGGPMVVADGEGWYKVAGVVSWGINCGLPQYPGVYARVSYFENWIRDIITIPDPNQYTTLYYEDFGGGDIPQGWVNEVIQGPTGFPGWEWTDTGGGWGGQLNSTTADNGYMILDSDAHGSSGVMEEVNLITKPFDLSDVTTGVALSLEHLARTFENADVSIYVSNDDFNTQTELYRWHNAPPHNTNGPNPVYSLFDISDVALGESNVKVKFKWVGSWDYWWLIDDVKIMVENPSLEVNFQVTDGEQPLEGVFISTQYSDQETTTDANGMASLMLYEAEYEISAQKAGFFPYETTIQVTDDGQLVEIIMDKIPAPEIEVDPMAIDIEVLLGFDAHTELTISNPGDADLHYTIFAIQPADKAATPVKAGRQGHQTATYDGFEVNEPFGVCSESPLTEKEHHPEVRSDKPDQPIEIHYDTGYNSGIGTGAAASFITAARFTAEELSDYYGVYELSAIKFHIRTNQFSEVNVKVWEGGSLSGPGTEIYSAEVTSDVLIEQWTIHELPESISLTPGEEYWIGYAIETTAGHPASVDTGPMEPEKGGWMFFNGSWSLLPDINPQLNSNWNIRGILEPVLGVEWITFSQDSGTVEPESEDVINVTFDASDPEIEIGDYTVNIHIVNNAGAAIIVPATMTVIPAHFDVTFVINDTDGNPINDAVVTLDGNTNNPGDYVFNEVEIGNHNYSVTKDNFLDVTGTVMVVNQDVVVNVAMIPDDATTAVLSVHVEDEFDQPVENAYFILDGFGNYLTDSQGEIEITIVDGQYDFTVTKFGMEDLSGTVQIAGDHTLNIEMVYLRYDVTLEALPAGGGSVNGAGEYYHGETATIEADPAEFYHFSHWSEGAHMVSEDLEYSFEVMSNRHLVANFQIFTYQISAEAVPSDGGAIDGIGEYEHGTEVTLTAIPAQGYEFVEWTEDGQHIEGVGNEYTFDALGDRDLVAHFILSTYHLTFDIRKQDNQPILDAVIEFDGTEYAAGHYTFEDLIPGTYPYVVSRDGYFDNPGNVTIHNQDVNHQVILSIDDTSIHDAIAMGINIYPNPASTVLSISAETEIEEIRILDLAGRTLYVSNPNQEKVDIPVHNLYNGIYLLQITTGGNSTMLKFQKN